jgi:type 1 glutamine amidotransferase
MTSRIYAVAGDYYHRADWSEQALQQAIGVMHERYGSTLGDASEAYELRMVPAEELGDAIGERPEVLIITKEQRLFPEAPEPGSWMNEELQAKLEQYVTSGGALLALHSGLAYQTDGIYRRMLRGWFLHHPEQKTVHYKPADGAAAGQLHLSAVSDFSFKDEHYFVHCEEAQTNVFLCSESEDGESIAGWTHEYGAGRVLCLTPAHTLEGLTNRMFIELLADCLQMLAKQADS